MDIYNVPASRLNEMAEVTADAFIGNDDPIGNFIFENEPRHLHLKRRFFRSIVTSCSPQAVYQAFHPDFRSVSIWFPPGMDHSQDVDVDPFQESDFQDPQTIERLNNVMEVIGELTADLGDNPQWYMHLIAVPKIYTGMHYASLLLAPMILRAEKERLPCTLITQRKENVIRYQHWGFQVAREMIVKGSNEKFTSMIKY